VFAHRKSVGEKKKQSLEKFQKVQKNQTRTDFLRAEKLLPCPAVLCGSGLNVSCGIDAVNAFYSATGSFSKQEDV
jgi:hypothetical protein